VSAALPFVRPTLREKRAAETRTRLFDCAIDEFKRVGFDRASVARIAREARVSRPSFYFHFPSKEHVLLEYQWSLENEVVARLAAGPDSLADVLDLLVDSLVDAQSSVGDPGLFREMLRIYATRPPHLPLDEQPFPTLIELVRRFQRAHERGELRPGLDPARSARLCLMSVFGALIARGPEDADGRGDLKQIVCLYLA
jgi:AcrR family transcriptional regulator